MTTTTNGVGYPTPEIYQNALRACLSERMTVREAVRIYGVAHETLLADYTASKADRP